MNATQKAAEALARVEKLERALVGAMQAGDGQADELARLSRVNARQRRRALWRAFCLLRQGRRADAVLALETERRELRDREPAR